MVDTGHLLGHLSILLPQAAEANIVRVRAVFAGHHVIALRFTVVDPAGGQLLEVGVNVVGLHAVIALGAVSDGF